ncbi:hypothetical protein DRC71_02135 [Staphylococcus pseudintermedius]|uniref:YPDG domain-containing protein n=1 Tax=Staphylococcus pseudintermedius TaxID=283734 RepID=UPI0015F208AF|nr:hypothetical protein DRC71_02135 [Staphylococcus pseudintermedius]
MYHQEQHLRYHQEFQKAGQRVDPDNGTVTVTPPADATPGTSVDIPVKVTYPDGSSEETPVKVTVDTPDSGNHDPGYEEGHTNRTYQWKCHKRKIQMYHQEQHLRYHQQVFQKAGQRK